MPPETSTLQVKGLAKRQIAQIVRRASRLGLTPERYLKHLVEEDLAISREAKTTTFGQLMGAGRQVDEREIDRLVEAAKTKHHRRVARKG
jgi:ABC-type uncharacterized transport system ATPase subunit